MKQTDQQQVKSVVIGMALGVMSQGVLEVTSSKTSLELGFNRAWRHWPKSGCFPSLGGHDPGNAFWIGLHKSERRKGVCAAAWQTDEWYSPYVALEGFSLEEALDVHADARVTSDDWDSLGRLFVQALRPDEVHRSRE